jgi:tRNA dimethylallyltransferase
MTCNLIVILGPTASGKTGLAVRLAKDLGSEVISADSRQVYRGMDIGTGKDIGDYTIDGMCIPYHMIDIVDPEYEFNVFEFHGRFFQCFSILESRGILPVLCGGTGLYIEAVLQGYRMVDVPEDCELRKTLAKETMESLSERLLKLNGAVHNTTDLLDRKRLVRAIEIAAYTQDNKGVPDLFTFPSLEPLVIGIHWERSVLRKRITERLEERFRAGLIEEVQNLHDHGVDWEKLNFFGLEYRYVGMYLQGQLEYERMFQILNTKIHQFSKRQETWFRRMEKQGRVIHWIEGGDYRSLRMLVDKML